MCCLIQITIQLCRTRQLTCQCRQAVFFIATDENGVDPRPNPHGTAHMGRAWHGSAGAAPVVASKQTGPVPHRSHLGGEVLVEKVRCDGLVVLSNWNDTKTSCIAEKENELLPWRSLELSKHSNSNI